MRIYLTLLFVVVSFCFLSGQVFLTLELFNDPETKKFYVGDKITYKTIYVDQWSKGVIKQILIEENTLILHNEILPINDVTHFMLYRNTVNLFSGLLQSFGALWLGYGTIAAAFGRANVSWFNVFSVGGGTLVGGTIFKKLFYRIPIKLGNQNRLRIIDTRFRVPNNP